MFRLNTEILNKMFLRRMPTFNAMMTNLRLSGLIKDLFKALICGGESILEDPQKLCLYYISYISHPTYTLAHRRPSVRFIRPKFCSQLTAGLQGSVVDRLKDLCVEVLSLCALKWETHEDEGISQTLNTDTDGPVTLVGILCLLCEREDQPLQQITVM